MGNCNHTARWFTYQLIMDTIDSAKEKEEDILDKTLSSIRANANKRELEPCGECYNCGEPIKEGLFCCVECRDEYEHYIECLRRNGKLRN